MQELNISTRIWLGVFSSEDAVRNAVENFIEGFLEQERSPHEIENIDYQSHEVDQP